MTYSPDEQALRHYFRPDRSLQCTFWCLFTGCAEGVFFSLIYQQFFLCFLSAAAGFLVIRYMPAEIKKRRLNLCLSRLDDLNLLSQAASHLTLIDQRHLFGRNELIITPEFVYVQKKGVVVAIQDIQKLSYTFDATPGEMAHQLSFTADHIGCTLIQRQSPSDTEALEVAQLLLSLRPEIVLERHFHQENA